jgi:hypothetical protein
MLGRISVKIPDNLLRFRFGNRLICITMVLIDNQWFILVKDTVSVQVEIVWYVSDMNVLVDIVLVI